MIGRWMRRVSALGAAGAVLMAGVMAPGHADSADTRPLRTPPAKEPVALGYGGAMSTVDAEATRAGLSMLRRGGTAVDAAVAAAAALGVTEPFSAGIGGGGFFVYYEAKTGNVYTLDGREAAPAAATGDLFIDPATGAALPFAAARVSGLSVGVPGTAATWDAALERWGRFPLSTALVPATRIAQRGFVVDETFRSQVEGNAAIFADFPASADLFLPGGRLPEVGSTLANPDLAATYRLLARDGVDAFYAGPLAADIAATVQDPPVAADADRNARPGSMTTDDLVAYEIVERDPTLVEYDGLQVFGMAPPSSGGTTVGEALNLLEGSELSRLNETDALHRYLEASALAFADRNRYVGDPSRVDVPVAELLSQGFADERACELDPVRAAPKPVAPGVPDGDYAACDEPAVVAPKPSSAGGSTTHLTAADRWGNVVAYTLTIEQTGGSGITVPERGFLLNNELTDFNFTPTQGDAPDPNLPGPGKRPRSSMSPTIVLEDGTPTLALGSPGGATIITTVLQTLVNRLEFGMDLPEALAAPRLSQLNSATTVVEPTVPADTLAALAERGHAFSQTAEIGAATGIEFFGDGLMQAVAEPQRRGGGSAAVWPA